MLAWAFVGYLLVRDEYEMAGDHAGDWETSPMLALFLDAVDLELLPRKGAPLIGAGGRMAPQDATAPFGREIFEAAAKVAVSETHHRLRHREMYQRHGNSLREGLWRLEDSSPGPDWITQCQ